LCTDRNCVIENGAILAPTMDCVTLSVRGKIAVCWNYSQRMLNQMSITGMEYTVTVMVIVNCTVCHLKEALFFVGQIAFNANSANKTSSVSPQHCAEYSRVFV